MSDSAVPLDYHESLKTLVGATVIAVRPMRDEEMRSFRWRKRLDEQPVVLTFEKDGERLSVVPLRDAMAIGPGMLLLAYDEIFTPSVEHTDSLEDSYD